MAAASLLCLTNHSQINLLANSKPEPRRGWDSGKCSSSLPKLTQDKTTTCHLFSCLILNELFNVYESVCLSLFPSQSLGIILCGRILSWISARCAMAGDPPFTNPLMWVMSPSTGHLWLPLRLLASGSPSLAGVTSLFQETLLGSPLLACEKHANIVLCWALGGSSLSRWSSGLSPEQPASHSHLPSDYFQVWVLGPSYSNGFKSSSRSSSLESPSEVGYSKKQSHHWPGWKKVTTLSGQIFTTTCLSTLVLSSLSCSLEVGNSYSSPLLQV